MPAKFTEEEWDKFCRITLKGRPEIARSGPYVYYKCKVGTTKTVTVKEDVYSERVAVFAGSNDSHIGDIVERDMTCVIKTEALGYDLECTHPFHGENAELVVRVFVNGVGDAVAKLAIRDRHDNLVEHIDLARVTLRKKVL